MVGWIAREERLKRENQPLLVRIYDALPGDGGAVSAEPEYAPESIRNVANRHELEVVIISVRKDSARIALCDPRSRTHPHNDTFTIVWALDFETPLSINFS